MPILSLLIDVFQKRRVIKEVALPLVLQASVANPIQSDAAGSVLVAGHAARREWVVNRLVTRGLSESEARLATEAAVRLWKKMEAKRQKKELKRAARAARA